MRPRKLVMQAFGSYGKKTLIDFTRIRQNLFLIAGNTGAGKTTIFDAMVFALYGEASSESNRKDGKELQSQFEDFTVEPFVELVFSETEGEEERLYRVRRVPRHLRPITRGKNKGGFRECQETVDLFLPDGSEYSLNKGETDEKLEEIVGLTKGQFMQVAMIAQGEFMELLRARSEEKKIIFRKLFHTEIFQQVVEELARRRKEMESGIEQVQLDCKKDVGRVRIPEDCDESGLAAIRKSILTPGKLNIAELEIFMEGLEGLCGKLGEKRMAAHREYEELSSRRDELLKDCTRARQLMRSFGELQKAEAELAECREREAEIQEARELLGRIREAYELRSLHQRYQDARKNRVDRGKALEDQKQRLPFLREREKITAEKEEETKAVLEKERTIFSKTEERVGKALELLKKIREAKRAEKEKKVVLAQKEAAAKNAQKALEDFEERERENRRQADALGNVGAAVAQLEAKQRDADDIAEDAARVEKAQKDLNVQKKTAEKFQESYKVARVEYIRHHESFLEKQRAFLDAQAGLLAREKLRPGKPCPVCGALEHPSPCRLSQEHRELTREIVEALAKEDDRLNLEQSKRSEETGKAKAACEEKKRFFWELAGALRKRMEGSIGDLPETMTPKWVTERLARWQEELRAERISLEQRTKALNAAQEFLKNADEKKQRLKKDWEQLSEQMTKAKSDLDIAKTAVEQMERQREYPTEEAARGALQEAAAAKDKAEMLYQETRKTMQKIRSDREGTELLIQRYEEELPKLLREEEERRDACDTMEREKGLSETQWQEIVEKHRKEEAEEIQSLLEDYTRRKSAAEGAKRAAREAIGEQRKPNIEELENASREIEERWKSARSRLEELKELFKTDEDVRRALKPQMEERSRMVREFSRLDGLHGRLAGKMSGARMDIETFVQRYYLEQVLQAANERFTRMSAGQFELRMTGEDQAGSGKNRGLDLMVYSVTTGKEREIRTLSGGESFMAALSLALGMADQIQENSSAIHLDVMFIDEGFGSLDDHSRNQAVEVLQQVAGGSRLIGIISHVSELRQEIENQLLVSKNEEGSHAKWVIS